MIQFNLLPDIKLEYIRTRRLKRAVISISLIVVAVSLAIVGILAGSVYGLQRGHISNLTEDIAKKDTDIKNIEQIDRLLTVQNQLSSINDIHDQKPVSSRLFTFIERLTPTDISINRIEVDFDEATMRITGEGKNLVSVNKFVDTLKFTEYAVSQDESTVTDSQSNEEESQGMAFSGVVLSSFERSNAESQYAIELTFDPEIFNSDTEIVLIIQDKITTRSELEKPDDDDTDPLFKAPTEEIE